MEITSLDQLDPTKEYTYADYLTWQFEQRVELIRGYIREMSAPNRRHQEISGNLFSVLRNYLGGKSCKVFAAPFDVRLPRINKKTNEPITTVIQPDLCVICDLTKLDVAGCLGAPDFVVEILSRGNTKKEMREKFSAYEESGVREYWVVQPEYDNILTYALNEKGRYELGLTLYPGDVSSPHIFPELQMDITDVFAD